MKFMIRGGTLLLIVVLTFPMWSKLALVQPIIYRIEFSADAYETGDVDAATSGREEIQGAYMEKMREAEDINIIFGNARTAMSTTGIETNSHNTYMDILFYFGIIGLALFALYQWKKIILLRGESYFYPLLTLKAILLIGASTVSVMSSTYFLFLIFI